MTSRSNRLGQFSDVQEILDAALEAGGGEYKLDNYGQAIHWTQRAYKFRKMFAAHIAPEPCPYDRLVMPRIAPGSSTVIIKLNKPKGVFTPKKPVAKAPDFSEAQNLLDSDDIF